MARNDGIKVATHGTFLDLYFKRLENCIMHLIFCVIRRREKQNIWYSGSLEFYIEATRSSTAYRLRPDVFIKSHWELLLGRQLSFIDTISHKKKNLMEVRMYFLISFIYYIHCCILI